MATNNEKLKLLKSLRLLEKIPDSQLAALSEYLRPKTLSDGEIVFEEGSTGSSLYFVMRGQIRISKRVSGQFFKDLAILGPGDCFGEMALIEEVARSARASSSGATIVCELARTDLNRWLKSHPERAMSFFTELVQVQSKRLRRTSNELALLFDLSNLFLENFDSGKDLLMKVLAHVVPHLEGSWSAAAYLYNVFNQEMDFVASQGEFDFHSIDQKLPRPTESRSFWVDSACYYVSLPGQKRPHGYLIFHAESPLTDEERNETGRTLSTVARLLTSALENINFRVEETLRARLKAKHDYGSPL